MLEFEHHLDADTSAEDRRFFTLARVAYLDLVKEIMLLEDALRDHTHLIRADVYQLPAFTDDDIGQAPEAIPITPYTGQSALELALSHLHSFKLDQEHSGRIIKRLPGIVAIEHREPLSLLMRIAAVNRKKQELHDLILAHCPSRDARFMLLVNIIPNVVKLKAFRDLLFANRPLYSVGFSWKHRQSILRLSKSKLMAMLDKSLAYYQSRFPLSPKTEQIQKERDLISQYPATSHFVQARDLRVAPAMNLRYLPDTDNFLPGRAPVDMIAHSPLLVINQSPRVHPLKPYDIQHAGTASNRYGELVLPRLCVYFDPRASNTS